MNKLIREDIGILPKKKKNRIFPIYLLIIITKSLEDDYTG